MFFPCNDGGAREDKHTGASFSHQVSEKKGKACITKFKNKPKNLYIISRERSFFNTL